MKILKTVLQEKRVSLLEKLQTPVLLIGRGDDVYLTADGYFFHAPQDAERTLFIVDLTVNKLVFKGKSYELVNICGNKMTYKSLQHSSGTEISFVLSYEKIETNVPNMDAHLAVVGGKPTTTLFVKI